MTLKADATGVLPPGDTVYQAPYAGHAFRYHSDDQIVEYANARVAIAKEPREMTENQKRQLFFAARNADSFESDAPCPHCNGTGRMVRDPDIGTDQECFVCDGSGRTDGDQAEFEWPKLPGLPDPMMYSPQNGLPLFSGHQMQGYANAYGEAVRIKLSAAIAALRERIAELETQLTRTECPNWPCCPRESREDCTVGSSGA